MLIELVSFDFGRGSSWILAARDIRLLALESPGLGLPRPLVPGCWGLHWDGVCEIPHLMQRQ